MEKCESYWQSPVVERVRESHRSISPLSKCLASPAPPYAVSDCCDPRLASNVNFNNILNLSYWELPSTCYKYFLHGFRDERDFEDFKQDLRDFLRLKRECWAANRRTSSQNDADGPLDHAEDDAFRDLNEELEVICRPSSVHKNRRKHSSRPAEQEQNPQPKITDHLKPDTCQCRCNTDGVFVGVEGRTQHRQDSFALREDFDRRSGLHEPLNRVTRRSGLPASRTSINHILMEFINGDEHFREFDRVYETVNGSNPSRSPAPPSRPPSAAHGIRRSSCPGGRHTSSDGNNNNSNGNGNVFLTDRMSHDNGHRSGRENDENGNSDEESTSFGLNGGARDSLVLYRKRDTFHRPSYVDDMLADFFDNDETFLEFEQEFQKFKSNRRSQMMLKNLSNMGSSKDIFGDLKAFCDRTLQQKERQRIWRMSSSKAMSSEEESVETTHDEEAMPVCPPGGQESQEAGHDPLIWRSVEDWERMLRKMKRNSRLLLDAAGHHPGQPQHQHHRRSVQLPRPTSSHGQQYDRTQSMADLTRFHGNPSLPSGDTATQSGIQTISAPPLGNRHSSCNLDSQGIDHNQGIRKKRSSVPNIAESSMVCRETNRPEVSPAAARPPVISLEECKEASLDDLLPTPTECKEAQWAKNFSMDTEGSRYSSTSTLCSSNGVEHHMDAHDADLDEDDASSCAFSCSMGSDLHIHEEGDYTDDDLDTGPPGHQALRQCSCPPSTSRSHSLMELNAGPGHRGHKSFSSTSLQATHSADNLRYRDSPYGTIESGSSVVDVTGHLAVPRPGHFHRAASVPCSSPISRCYTESVQQPHRPTSSKAACDEALVCDIDKLSPSARASSASRDGSAPLSWPTPRPPSAVSDRLSDLESNDTYDTATSDLSDAELSDHFSTAKSDLSLVGPMATGSALSSLSTRSRSFDLDLSDISGAEDDEDDWTPGSSPPDHDDPWARHGVKDITLRYEQQALGNECHQRATHPSDSSSPYSRGHCHSYHGTEAKREHNLTNSRDGKGDGSDERRRPLSGEESLPGMGITLYSGAYI